MGATSVEIRIALVSSREIFREALAKLLAEQPGFAVVACTDADPSAAVLVYDADPDVILVEHDTSSGKWLSALRAFANFPAPIKAILLSDQPGHELLFEHSDAGLHGVLAKDATTALLFKCIRCVRAGEYWIGRDGVADLMKYLRSAKEKSCPNRNQFGLTPREQDVLRALLTGASSNKEIAHLLCISEQAVRHHLSAIFGKVGVSNRLELGLFAMQNGLHDTNGSSVRDSGSREYQLASKVPKPN